MKRFFADMNPTLRGFLIIALVALVIVVLQLQATLTALFLIARIAFFIAIAVFVFLWWRSRRADIDMWSDRSRRVFYAAAILIVLDLALFFSPVRVDPIAGPTALAFIAVLVICAFAMWRVWRDEHTYSG